MRILFAILALTFIVFSPEMGYTHDQYHDWKRPDSNISCCDNQDCKPVNWRINRQAQLELEVAPGEWIVPPPNAEIKNKVDPKGEAHWCGTVDRMRYFKVITYCYLPPKPPS